MTINYIVLPPHNIWKIIFSLLLNKCDTIFFYLVSNLTYSLNDVLSDSSRTYKLYLHLGSSFRKINKKILKNVLFTTCKKKGRNIKFTLKTESL